MIYITIKPYKNNHYMPSTKEDFMKLDALGLFPFINKESVPHIEDLKGIKFIIEGDSTNG